MSHFSRRNFLFASSSSLFAMQLATAESSQPRKAAVIGHTGRGNYGHSLDVVWGPSPDIQVVAVADSNPVGLKKELEKLNVTQGFLNYHEMLKQVQPEFVSICPRHADQHFEMAKASIEAGVRGIYIEKPFCRTPEEADQLIELCNKQNTKIAIAHRNRYHPVLKVIDQLIDSGKLGRVLEIRARGKGDHRGGAEDLWVLGTHVLNLVHYFAGKPTTCSAVMLQNGKHVTKKDVRTGNEGLGLIAGNELHARFETTNDLVVYFDSIANDGTKNAGFGLQIVGSKATVNLQCDSDPVAHIIFMNPFDPFTTEKKWLPITSSGVDQEESNRELINKVHSHQAAVQDLIRAVDENREPVCNVTEGAMTVEMVCAVFESHRQGGMPVKFPLEQRKNALELL